MCSAISRVLPAGTRGVWSCAQTTPARTKIIGAGAHLLRYFICLFCDCPSLLTKIVSIHRDQARTTHTRPGPETEIRFPLLRTTLFVSLSEAMFRVVVPD